MTIQQAPASGPDTGAPAPDSGATTPQPPAAPEPSQLDSMLDDEERQLLAGLAAEGLSIDGTEPPPATTEAQPPTPAPTPAPTEADRLAQVEAENRRLAAELARTQGIIEGQARTTTGPSPHGGQPQPTQQRPQPTPAQILAHLDGQRAALDKKFDDGEIDAPDYRKWMRELDRQEMNLRADVYARQAAEAYTRPLAQQVAELPTKQLQSDPWLKQASADLMAREPWTANVPPKVWAAYEDEAMDLARTKNLRVDRSPEGVWNFRRCLMAVAKAHGQDRAYGAQGSPQQTTAGGTPTQRTAPAPGSQPIPAPPVRQPPALAVLPGGMPAPVGGISAERVAAMSFMEAADGLTDEQLEAIAPSR